MKNTTELLNEHTRAIYHQQHIRQGEDVITRERLMNLTSEDFFGVNKGFFSGKKVLDAGCGSIARNAIGFYKMGAKDITALDLSSDWFETAQKNMNRYNIAPESIKLVAGNVSELDFNDEEFDFVCCDGVLPHLADISQVEKTISELSRVTKKGGHLFISYLAGGGLIETKIHDAAREFYKENKVFAELIDNIKPSTLHELVNYSLQKIQIHSANTINLDLFKDLLDEDLCIAIQNLLQAKMRTSHSKEFVDSFLKSKEFGEIKILKRFVERKNIRKFLAPFHFYSEDKFSKLLYGDGWVDCISQKQ